MYSITFLRFAFSIWRCANCFLGTFSQINFCRFSGEALSLPSAFVYFAVVSLLVPTVYKIFCSRKFNSMLVPAAEQFVPQTPEFLHKLPKSTSTESSWDNLADSNAVQIFNKEPITDQLRPWIFSRTLSKPRSFRFFLSLRISFTKSSRIFTGLIFSGTGFLIRIAFIRSASLI